jgi:hypothetical protein
LFKPHFNIITPPISMFPEWSVNIFYINVVLICRVNVGDIFIVST